MLTSSPLLLELKNNNFYSISFQTVFLYPFQHQLFLFFFNFLKETPTVKKKNCDISNAAANFAYLAIEKEIHFKEKENSKNMKQESTERQKVVTTFSCLS